MDIHRNNQDALPDFARLNLDWIKDLHVVEPSDQAMADNPQAYVEGENSVFSIHIEGKVAGVCALKKDHNDEFELTKMAVDPAFQGRGLGEILMETVETYAKTELGLARIYLLSNTKNAAAIRLYKRCGWTVTHQGPHPQYARCNIGMEKIF